MKREHEPFELRLFFTGLFIFVPKNWNDKRDKTDSMTVLMVDARAPGRSVIGKPFFPHTPLILFNKCYALPKQEYPFAINFDPNGPFAITPPPKSCTAEEGKGVVGLWPLDGDDLIIKGKIDGKDISVKREETVAFKKKIAFFKANDVWPSGSHNFDMVPDFCFLYKDGLNHGGLGKSKTDKGRLGKSGTDKSGLDVGDEYLDLHKSPSSLKLAARLKLPPGEIGAYVNNTISNCKPALVNFTHTETDDHCITGCVIYKCKVSGKEVELHSKQHPISFKFRPKEDDEGKRCVEIWLSNLPPAKLVPANPGDEEKPDCDFELIYRVVKDYPGDGNLCMPYSAPATPENGGVATIHSPYVACSGVVTNPNPNA